MVIFVGETTVNVADLLLKNFTEVAPVKPVPLMVTEVPTGPLVGENEVIVGTGEGVTVKFVELAPVPSSVVTLMGPVVAPDGTLAVIFVLEFTVKVAAAVVLNFTSVAPEKWFPLMVTDVPTGPLVGENESISGAGAARASGAARPARSRPTTNAPDTRMP